MAPLVDLLRACFVEIPKNKLPFEISSRAKAQVMLDDWRREVSSGHYELLLSKADADQSDVSLRKLRSRSRRNAEKQPDEGFEDSVHGILRANPDGTTATLLLTMGAAVGAKEVTLLLKALLKRAASKTRNHSLFSFDDPSAAKSKDGQPEQYRVRYNFEYESYMGETLTTALQTGSFQSMELIGSDRAKFDEQQGNLQITGHTLEVKAVAPALVTPASLINGILGFNKRNPEQHFQTVRFHFSNDDGTRQTASVPINDLEAAFARKDRIEFDTDVESYQPQLHSTIIGHLRRLMRDTPS